MFGAADGGESQPLVADRRAQGKWGRRAVLAVAGTGAVGLGLAWGSSSATRPVALWQVADGLRGFRGYDIKEWRFGRPMQTWAGPGGEDDWQRAMDVQMMRSNLAADDSESSLPPEKCLEHPEQCAGRADYDGTVMVIFAIAAMITVCILGICSLQSKGHIDLLKENPD